MLGAVGKKLRSERASALVGSMLALSAVAAACAGRSDVKGPGDGDAGGGGLGQGGRATGGSGVAGSDAGDGGSRTSGGAGGTSGDGGVGGSDAGAGGTDAGAGGDGGDGGSPDGGVAGDTTIVDRPPRLEQDCTVVRPSTLLGVDWYANELGVTASGAFVLYAPVDANDRLSGLVLSSLDSDGTLETLQQLVPPGVTVEDMSLHARTGGLSASWGGDDVADVAIADFDANGLPARAPLLLDASYPKENRILATDSGYALLTIEGDSEVSDVVFTAYDADAVRVGLPVNVYSASHVDSGGTHSQEFIAVPGGFLAQVLHTSEDPEDHPGAYLFPLDAQGAVTGPDLGSPWDLARSMLVLGDDLLVAFEVPDTDDSSRCVLGMGRINLSSMMRTLPDIGVFETLPPISTRYAFNCSDSHAPRLFAIGENVGLHWREVDGSRFVILARDDLTPVSRVVTLSDLPPGEGYFGRVGVQALGSDILVVSSYYRRPRLYYRGASATISCRRLL